MSAAATTGWSPTWVLLFSLLLSAPAIPGDAGNAPTRYHYGDIERFFLAYEKFQESGDAHEFQRYLDQGSIGLQEFRAQFALTPERLAETVRTYPGFFRSLDHLETTVRGREAELAEMFSALSDLFPNAPPPDVYFLVGGLRAGGQAGSGNHVMVAAEIYAKTPATDTSELKPGKRMYAPDDIVNIVAHEAAHIIQEETQGTEKYLSVYTDPAKGTLLAYALREGVANLVAKLASGDHINPEAEAYGMRHEEELWSLFAQEALDTELGDWFFYRPREHADWPRDLGYWMGYRIALRCYESAADKAAMLERLLRADDPETLLRKCGPPDKQKSARLSSAVR